MIDLTEDPAEKENIVALQKIDESKTEENHEQENLVEMNNKDLESMNE